MRYYRLKESGEAFHDLPTILSTRIERYIDRMPPAISGQHGHTATFKVALVLVRGFNLSPKDALPFLQRFNGRCQPPWTDEELRYKLDSADKLKQAKDKPPLKPRGYLL